MIKHKHFLQKGFTLVELIIVICVLGILAAIITLSYDGYQERVDQTQINTTADAYMKSLKTYALEYNSYPKVSTCLPTGSKCCTSNVADLPTVYCGTNTEAAGIHNWATDNTDVKITKYINNQAPTFPIVSTFADCTSGVMSNGPCKATASIPTVGIAYISNQTGSKYTSDDAAVAGKGFLVYYVAPTMVCGSKDIMTLSSNKLVFNSNATYTRQTSVYRECIIGLRTAS